MEINFYANKNGELIAGFLSKIDQPIVLNKSNGDIFEHLELHNCSCCANNLILDDLESRTRLNTEISKSDQDAILSIITSSRDAISQGHTVTIHQEGLRYS